MRIDAHQHFWRLSNPFCDWPTSSEQKIHRDFGPDDLAPLLKKHDIGGTVLVQAAPSLAETRYLLELGEQSSFVKGVVGWIDFESSSAVQDLDALARHPLFCGVRPMLQSIDDPAWVLNPDFDGIFEHLTKNGLTFDALIRPVHLASLLELSRRHPELPIIIDHAAKPAIRDGEGAFDDWAMGMARLAAQKNISCKISGLLTEAQPGAGFDDLLPWLDYLYAGFGADRLLWGSDWPVLLMEESYGAWISLCERWLESKPEKARQQIFGMTASRIYGLANAERSERVHATGGARNGTH